MFVMALADAPTQSPFGSQTETPTGDGGLLAHFLRMRALGREQQAAEFIAGEIVRHRNGNLPHIQTIEALEAVFQEAPPSQLELGPYLDRVCSAMRPSVAAIGSIHLNCQCEADCVVDRKVAIPVALIVCELVLNAAKYAHPAGVAGRVDVGCYLRDRNLFVEVADDGIGLPVDFDPATDGFLGFEMIRGLTKLLGSEPRFQSHALGLQFLLSLTN
jgi:two-component sensor histidine kinase